MNNLMYGNYTNQKLIILPGANIIETLKVKGIDGAKAYTTQPNTIVPLFDSDDDYFYMVTTDENGNKKDVARFRFEPCPVPKPEEVFASKDDLNQLKGDIANVEQLVRQLLESTNATNATNADSGKSDRQYSKNNGKPRNEATGSSLQTASAVG